MSYKTFLLAGFAAAVLLASAPLDDMPARHADRGLWCVPGSDPHWHARPLRCGRYFAQLIPPRSQEPGTNLEGGWRLLRTPDPRGGRESIAVSHSADLLRSDSEFAGMMLRCIGGQIELVFVLVRPLPPRSRPQVALNFDGKSLRFEAAVVPPGASIRLPPEAAALAGGAWHSVRELSVAIEDGAAGKINGVVPLEGLRAAYAVLRAACEIN